MVLRWLREMKRLILALWPKSFQEKLLMLQILEKWHGNEVSYL